MHNDLVFDVGAGHGDDAAYYLWKGFRVVAIEANPSLIPALTKRFCEQMRAGTFTLVSAGIAESDGEREFWVCEDVSEWSSFHIEIASRENARHSRLIVPTVRFATLLERYGVPFYCKVDIEGNDRLCLQDLNSADKPQFVSREMPHSDADVDFHLLKHLGYKRFKIVSQVSRAQPTRTLTRIAATSPVRLRDTLLTVERRVRGKGRDGDWVFPFGSSGPFGEETPGPWRNVEDALALWRHLKNVDEQHGLGGLGDWYDIHAAV
jgi:FkbM family methyltransferase